MTFDTSNNGAGFALVRGMWAAIAISAFILILRVFAKVKLRQFRFDDVLMIVSWVLRSPPTRTSPDYRSTSITNHFYYY